ncbi:MAG: serine/threonine-protein kinase, partial [Byssovorax sp.]
MSALASGAVIAGKYRLEREIGRGGMGSVWAARHLTLDTPVALKFIDPDASAEDAHLRFEREAKAAAQLRSPHVVQILDHGLDHRPEGELPYIAMELLDGEDLSERLRRRGRLSIPEAANIFGQAAKALRRAHDAGVIHRDLKPSNIFLARFDDDEVVKLLDFGVAKLRRGEMDPQNPATQTGVIFGSPTYMSP